MPGTFEMAYWPFLTTKNAFITKIFANSRNAFFSRRQTQNFSNLPSALLLAKIISLARLCVIEEYRKNVLSVLYDVLSNLKNFRTRVVNFSQAVTLSSPEVTRS